MLRSRLILAGLAVVVAMVVVVGAAGLATGDRVLTAQVCVKNVTGQVRVLQDESSSCRPGETAFVWAVGGSVGDIVGGSGITVERRDTTVSLGIDAAVIQAKVMDSCGDGTDGSAIAAINGDGTVECTFPHGIVAVLNAGTVVAAGSTSLSACQMVERASLVPIVHQSNSFEIELPPGQYRALQGIGQEFVGAPLTWRINKSARRDDVWSHYQGSIRAIVQHKDPNSSNWRRATQHLRHVASTGGGGHPDIAHDLNVENEDLGIFTFGFTQKVRLVIQAVATPCTWSQIGGQVAIERIG